LRHKVQGGETLSHIALRFDTTVAVLRKANELRGNSIRTGQQLIIPVGAQDAAHYASLVKDKPLQASGKELNYRVRSGDNLWVIARTHNVSIEQLSQWNNLASGASIKPGQQLTIRQQQNTTQASNTVRPVNYTVRREIPVSHLQKFNVNHDLKEWNELQKKKYSSPGKS
jgi:membrane-bound lytic murein transglycosylase D